MKIASYNIMSGGFKGYDYELAHPERLADIQRVVRELGADIIGLIDTFRWDEVFSDDQLRELFGYDHVMTINLNDDRLRKLGHNNGLTLLSRVPWLSCETLHLGTRDALKGEFKVADRKVEIILAYLDDLDEDVRVTQAKAALSQFDEASNGVLMGDLNTLSPNDAEGIASRLEVFYLDNPGIEGKFGKTIAKMQRGEVVKLLEAYGLQDAGKGGGATMPTLLFPAAARQPILRVDHCFYGQAVMVRDFAVHKTPAAQKASDHFPISFTIE
jgi:endonuclease/exonuclease/phosphatase family metal-dependent hydrolase